MGIYRQRLAGMLRTAVDQVQENNDEIYGKQLATLLERHSLVLRSRFGGTPLWATRPIRLTRRKRATDISRYIESEKEQQENGN